MRARLPIALIFLTLMNALSEVPYSLVPPEKNDTALPNVLLLGDSISLGYAPFVREQLKGRANVYRIQGSEALTVKPAGGLRLDTAAAREHLDEWLGSTKWSVIHFNWGLHDLKLTAEGNPAVSLEEYERNLRDLIARLKATGATLIWASTTPVPVGADQGGVARKEGSEIAYNEAAAKVMGEAGVAIDDLHAVVTGDLAKWQRPANVHFTEEGSRELAQCVVASLERTHTLPASGTSVISEDALELPLWDGPPPGAVEGATPGADDGTGRVRNVGIPAMAIHRRGKPGESRPAILVCPGGGYAALSNYAVGNGSIAEFGDKAVIIVLRYRLSPPSKNVAADALADAKRAMRLIRLNAKEWGIDPQQIGMLGWSAGANLTLNLASHFDEGDPAAANPVDRESCRPEFVAMLCPWPHSRPIADFPISAQAPPAFIASAKDDQTAPTRFAEEIAESYQRAGVPATLWQIPEGGHKAFSYRSTGEGSQWPDHFRKWFKATFPAARPL